MSYFTHFPRISFLKQDVINLAVGVSISNLIQGDAMAYMNYEVTDNETPDHVAYNYYQDSSMAWLVLLANKILDPYFEWPLSIRDFESFIKKKYGSIAAAQATTMHCEHKTKNITVAADSLAVSGGVSASDYTAIDSYAYWEQVNENRRFINLINVAHLSTIQTATRNLLRKTPR